MLGNIKLAIFYLTLRFNSQGQLTDADILTGVKTTPTDNEEMFPFTAFAAAWQTDVWSQPAVCRTVKLFSQ